MHIFGPPNIEKMKARRDVDGLIKALAYKKGSSEGQDRDVRENAASALGELGDQRSVEPLIAALKGHDVGNAAVKVLGRIGGGRAVGPLMARLKELEAISGSEGHRVVVEALSNIGAPAVKSLIVALRDRKAGLRKDSARLLGRIGDCRAVEGLIAALQDEVIWVRDTAAEALGQLGDPRAIEPLAAALKEKGQVGEAAARALGRIGSPPAVDALLAGLDDGQADRTQLAIIEALRESGGRRAVKPLIAALKDGERAVRKAAAEVLEALGWEPAAETDTAGVVAYWLIKDKPDKCVELGEGGIEPLIAALAVADIVIMRPAAEALGKIGDARAIEPLIAGLKSSSWHARQAAARALVQVYQRQGLSSQAKANILAQRDRIQSKHDDIYSCSYHTDSDGVGVDFPL